jgi:hypothetical protein
MNKLLSFTPSQWLGLSDFLINFCNVSQVLAIHFFYRKAAVDFVRVEHGSYASCFLLGFFSGFMGDMDVSICSG